MAEQGKVEGRKVLITGMSVKGGDLPNGFQVYTNVMLDYNGVSEDDLMALASEGSSVRVKAQAKMRKWSTTELLKYGVKGVEGLTAEVKTELKYIEPFTFDVETDFEKAETGPRDPVTTATRALGKMTDVQKIAFFRECGFEEQADVLQEKIDGEREETGETD